jgi:hypothetical protein
MRATRDPAAEAFIAAMFDGVLMENFTLEAHAFLPTDGNFHETADDEHAFRAIVCAALGVLASRECPECRTAFLDTYPSGFLGAHALALWFLRFDEDNWFGFDAVLQRTLGYLAGPRALDARRELRFFKGFDPRGLLVEASCPPDLPVVVDYGARTITILTGELRD